MMMGGKREVGYERPEKRRNDCVRGGERDRVAVVAGEQRDGAAQRRHGLGCMVRGELGVADAGERVGLLEVVGWVDLVADREGAAVARDGLRVAAGLGVDGGDAL